MMRLVGACYPHRVRFVFRRLLIVLIAVALAGGMGVGRVHAVASGMPCGMMMMPSAASGAHAKPVPCKGMTPDCIKQLGCAVDAGLPWSRAGGLATVRVSATRYWPLSRRATGWFMPPDPWPPRAI